MKSVWKGPEFDMCGSGFEGCRYRPLLSLNQNGQIRQTGPNTSAYLSEAVQKGATSEYAIIIV